jgi:hypothetical protein
LNVAIFIASHLILASSATYMHLAFRRPEHAGHPAR